MNLIKKSLIQPIDLAGFAAQVVGTAIQDLVPIVMTHMKESDERCLAHKERMASMQLEHEQCLFKQTNDSKREIAIINSTTEFIKIMAKEGKLTDQHCDRLIDAFVQQVLRRD
jgi:hypothetical protein